jgi:hypothetical protein
MSPTHRFHPKHVDRTGEFTVPLPLRQVFPLVSPEGERAWVPGWDPLYLHPDHPSNAPGTVFRTSHNNEETIWLLLEYSPAEATAHYGRFTPGSRIGTVLVRCQEAAADQTRVSVSYSLTALTPAGNDALSAMTEPHYRAMLQDWRQWILTSQRGLSAT